MCIAVAWLTVALLIPTQSCRMPDDYVGLTYFLDDRPYEIQLATDRVVARLEPGLGGDPWRVAPAVWVVAHELGHARGHTSTEPGANRWARRNWSLVVRTLGGDWRLAVRLWGYL